MQKYDPLCRGYVDRDYIGRNILLTSERIVLVDIKALVYYAVATQILDDLPHFSNMFIEKGRVLEDDFDARGYPMDTDSDGVEHPLSQAWVRQHERQRMTIMTNTALIEDFASLSALTHANNASISAQEQQRLATVEEARWRQEILTKNDEYESLLHTNTKRAADSDRSLLSNDLQAIEIGGAARSPDSVLAFLARKQGKSKPFVQARRMSSKGDANFSTPSHVGKIAGLKLHYPQIMDGTITVNDLDTKDQTWILLAALKYTQPITVQRMELPSEGDETGSGDSESADSSADTTPTVSSRTLIVDTSTA